MRLAAAAAAGLLAAACLGAAPRADAAGPQPRHPLLRDVRSFAFAIGDTPSRAAVARLKRFDLVVVDGELVPAATVRALRSGGTRVLAYLSVGTLEDYRPWWPRLKRYRLEFWPDWGEWYADVAAPGFRDAMTREIAPAILAKGFDGLFLDNVDMIENHPRQVAGMRSLVAGLSAVVRPRGRVLFAQNGEGVMGPMLRHLDGWNRESVTATHVDGYAASPPQEHASAVAALKRFRRAGLLVTATDYVTDDDSALARRAVRVACAAGALPYLSDRELRRIPARPVTCG